MKAYDIRRDGEWRISFVDFGEHFPTAPVSDGGYDIGPFHLPGALIEQRVAFLNFSLKRGYFIAKELARDEAGRPCYVVMGTEIDHIRRTLIPQEVVTEFNYYLKGKPNIP